MKNLIIVLFTFMTCNFAMAQYGFLYTNSNYQKYDEISTTAIEDIYGNYIISYISGIDSDLDSIPYNGKLLKLSPSGDSLKTLDLQGASICDFIQVEGCIIGIGLYKSKADTGYLYFCKINNNLDVLYDTIYTDNDVEIGSIGFVKIQQKDDKLIVLVSKNPLPSTVRKDYMYEMSLDGDIIKKKYIANFVFDFLIKQDKSGYYAFGRMGSHTVPNQIAVLDNDFNIISIDSLLPEFNNDMEWLATAKWFNDNTFLYAANKSNGPPKDYRNIAITRINKHTRKAIYEFETGMGGDTIDYCAFYNTMDFIDSNKIYFAGVNNMVIAHPFHYFFHTWISIFQLDSTLKVQWELQIGGDAHYGLHDVIATRDGGCLFIMTHYDRGIQIHERDLYILKVNADGSYNAINMPPDVTSRIVVFPNPGSNAMHIRFTDNKPDRTLLMFDMSGKQVLQTPLSDTDNTISTEGLPQGMYIYHLQENNKTIQSGKWIKQ